MRGLLPFDLTFPKPQSRSARCLGDCYDTAFESVILACAESSASRDNTWINEEIVTLYSALHRMGHSHWSNAGGMTVSWAGFGLSIGGAFFGESMFTKEKDASKVALVYLVMRLRIGGYRLDTVCNRSSETVWLNEISRQDYQVSWRRPYLTRNFLRGRLGR